MQHLPDRAADHRQVGQTAQIAVTFIRPVKIRTARREQVELFGIARKFGILFRGVTACNNFQRPSAQSGELGANFAYEVFVEGASAVKQTVTRDNIAQQQNIALRLAPGDHAVRIVKQGTGKLYYASAMQYYSAVETVGAARSLDGPTVRREYLDPQTDKTLTSFKVGDIVRVKLTLDMPREGWYMMVSDPLPAGFEAINYSLNTTGVEPNNPQQFRYYWSRPDLHDDRAVFFTTYLWKGKHVYTYLMRATSSGTFRALPAEATPMYEPEVFGRSASAEMVVKP